MSCSLSWIVLPSLGHLIVFESQDVPLPQGSLPAPVVLPMVSQDPPHQESQRAVREKGIGLYFFALKSQAL